MLTMVLFAFTNSISALLSSGAGAFLLRRYKAESVRIWDWDDSAALLKDLNATQSALAASHAQLADLHVHLGTANSLLETLLAGMATCHGDRPSSGTRGGLAISPGSSSSPSATTGTPPAMRRRSRTSSYSRAATRWRCRLRSPVGYVQPAPLPKSLWAIPPDTTVVWDAYRCKNYSCLLHGGGEFDLRGREKGRWLRDDGALAYSIEGVLAARPNGTVRIGLDIGGVSGTFAARMHERGVTVVTASTNSGGPSSLIASGGLMPVHVSPAHRLPFFNGTLDVDDDQWRRNSPPGCSLQPMTATQRLVCTRHAIVDRRAKSRRGSPCAACVVVANCRCHAMRS
ncbi:hypothetical protein E2562_035317 [Oryza meyeriana var. granulata]|uniref:Uncharacterized protein n=1 Tax=Oryza meyeriana var. granulata TaxID=110450 RepID=A0A6G1CL13_9ORYZ|nr:hypothetical protein E2562_035317 [Oryza meyeriana var. granulata]